MSWNYSDFQGINFKNKKFYKNKIIVINNYYFNYWNYENIFMVYERNFRCSELLNDEKFTIVSSYLI